MDFDKLTKADAIKVAKLLRKRKERTYKKLYEIVQGRPTKRAIWEAMRLLIGIQEAPHADA